MGEGYGGFDDMRAQVELALVELENSVQPVYAAAERVKQQFISMGWTTDNAEKAALSFLSGVMSGGGQR